MELFQIKNTATLYLRYSLKGTEIGTKTPPNLLKWSQMVPHPKLSIGEKLTT